MMKQMPESRESGFSNTRCSLCVSGASVAAAWFCLLEVRWHPEAGFPRINEHLVLRSSVRRQESARANRARSESNSHD